MNCYWGKIFVFIMCLPLYWETKADPVLQQNSLNVKVKEYGYVEKLSRYNSLLDRILFHHIN